MTPPTRRTVRQAQESQAQDIALTNRLVTVVGATASGKSEAAVLVAKHVNGEVINSDSRLFYRGMDVGTAKPPAPLLEQVPHHLVSFLEPSEPFSLAQFMAASGEIINGLHSAGKVPVIAGGTGQYVWGLLEGWQVPEVPPDPGLRSRLEHELAAHGVEALYQRLQQLNPEVAATIDGNNHRRVIRALEREAAVARPGNRRASDPGYDSLIIGLFVERAELHRRIVERIDNMLAGGWVEEVKALIEKQIDFDSPALSAIGYREIASAIAGDITFDEARERTIHATNRLVRHQNNWFKQTDARIRWVDVTDGNLRRALEPLDGWLAEYSGTIEQEKR